MGNPVFPVACHSVQSVTMAASGEMPLTVLSTVAEDNWVQWMVAVAAGPGMFLGPRDTALNAALPYPHARLGYRPAIRPVGDCDFRRHQARYRNLSGRQLGPGPAKASSRQARRARGTQRLFDR